MIESPMPDTSTARRRAQRDAERRALDAVTAWLNDPRLHSDPGTLEDVFHSIRRTGRYVGLNALACCSHADSTDAPR